MSGAADALRAALRAAAADPALAPGAGRLLALLDSAIAEAEASGVRSLARSIPHELGQPLAEVRGYAELLSDFDYPAEERAELLKRVEHAADRLSELLHAVGRLADPARPIPAPRSVAGMNLIPVEVAALPAAVQELRRSAAAHLRR